MSYSEEVETLKGTIARFEVDIAEARERGDLDLVDELLDPALEAQEMLDEAMTRIEHVIPDIPMQRISDLREHVSNPVDA